MYIRIYSPFAGYTFNLGDYKFETKFTNEKSETRKIGLPPAANRGESISRRESRHEVVAASFPPCAARDDNGSATIIPYYIASLSGIRAARSHCGLINNAPRSKITPQRTDTWWMRLARAMHLLSRIVSSHAPTLEILVKFIVMPDQPTGLTFSLKKTVAVQNFFAIIFFCRLIH